MDGEVVGTGPSGEVDATFQGAALQAELGVVEAQIADLTAEFDAIVEAAAADAPDDEHDPDGSTVGFERARVAALLDHARARRVEIDRAFGRLRAGAYGSCHSCGRPIGAERLAALPDAQTCVACAARPRSRLSRDS